MTPLKAPSIPVEARKPSSVLFGHMPRLDGFRGMAILLVLLGHTLQFSLHLSDRWGALGGSGVLLFFALSGFLITGLLCNEEARHGTIDLVGFYRDRALRIFPAFYFLLAVTSLLVALKLVTGLPWYSVAVCALFLRDIFGRGEALTHIWTLSLEQQFYAFWPLLVRAVKCRFVLRWAVAIAVLVTVWRTVAIVLKLWNYDSGRYYVRPDFRIDSILIGCCLALVLYRPRETPVSSTEQAHPRLLQVARLAHPVWVLPALLMWTVGAIHAVALRPVFVTIQMTLAGLLLLNAVLCGESFWARFLSSAWLRQVGRFSYSIYLWQQIFLVEKLPDWGWVRVFPFDAVAACVAGIASYYLIEQPFLRWKKSLQKRSLQDA